VVEVTGEGDLRWVIMVTNGPASLTARHRVSLGGRNYEWSGNYAVEGLKGGAGRE
jgi:hypothetical protein